MNIFRQEEKKPYTYSSIEMRKSSNRTIWIIMGLLILVIGFIFLFSKNSQKSTSLSVPTSVPETISGLKEYKNDTYNWSFKYDSSKYYPYEPGAKGDPATIWFYKKEPNGDFYCVNNFEVEVLKDNQTKKVIENPEKLTISDWLTQREAKSGTLFPQFSKRELTKINDYEAMKFINDGYKEAVTRIKDPFKPIIYLVAAKDKIFFLSYNISTDKETKQTCNGNEEAMDKIFQTFTYIK